MEKIDTFFAIIPSLIAVLLAIYYSALVFQTKNHATRDGALDMLADLRLGYGAQLLMLAVSGGAYIACAAMQLPIFGMMIVFMTIVSLIGTNVAIHTVDKYA